MYVLRKLKNMTSQEWSRMKGSTDYVDVSIVFPAYNEADNIATVVLGSLKSCPISIVSSSL